MWVVLEATDQSVTVHVDGADHLLEGGGVWRGIALDQPGPLLREYQIDGSDTTSTLDRDPRVILRLQDSPLYRVDAWLRDEASYSRWENVRIVDGDTGHAVPTLRSEIFSASGVRVELLFDGEPPRALRVEAALRRPEAAARLWLLTSTGQQGLELDRDRRNARWLIQRGGANEALPRWFFPEQAAPFVAELLHLIGRATAAAYALALTIFALGALARRTRPMLAAVLASTVGAVSAPAQPGGGRAAPNDPSPLPTSTPAAALSVRGERHANRHSEALKRHANRQGSVTIWEDRIAASAGQLILTLWLLAAALISTRLYHQLPHILDAVSYYFQAGVFRGGQLWLVPPDIVDAFRGPFEVVSNGRWFSQYPPGAPVAYALGGLVGLDWLVGPVACVVLIGATAWSAAVVHGRGTGYVVLLLGVLSPFILFQAGSFLSHPIAGGLLAGALAAFVMAEKRERTGWYALGGALLGGAFVTREAAGVLFALPLLARISLRRRWQALAWVAACGLPFLLVYLLYNQQLTGNPLLLPRAIFDASDRFGFGDGLGFHRRHTLAAGLANTDELLTLLQFDLSGWPPLFSLGLLGVPFLFGRARPWDVLAGCGALAFVLAYMAYFYHGIALGPRYYFEALPWLLLLGGRGLVVLGDVTRSRVATTIAVVLLSLNAVAFYVPTAIQRRTDFSAIPDTVRNDLAFVGVGVFGARLDAVPTPSLIVTNDWWLFNTSLAALNCPRVPDCAALFALATTPEDTARLRQAYPGRVALRAVQHDGRVDLEPD